ncbi:hypothetical protein EYF80_040951 [Liparis tanakae]|uniref:Uncharacterized protein n=1 Tax=Liparis tanakae TaxID=230148 RepID=A0A4Z2G6X5_9TELE|nr:hypothetical protein EYF80_040951 [Liparis tanakae]
MTSSSSPASWAFLARVCERTENSSCSSLVTPNAAARRSALWPIVSATEPLAEGLRPAEGQHGLPHLTAMADRNIRHELHPSCNDGVALACSNQTDTWREGGKDGRREGGGDKQRRVHGQSVQPENLGIRRKTHVVPDSRKGVRTPSTRTTFFTPGRARVFLLFV